MKNELFYAVPLGENENRFQRRLAFPNARDKQPDTSARWPTRHLGHLHIAPQLPGVPASRQPSPQCPSHNPLQLSKDANPPDHGLLPHQKSLRGSWVAKLGESILPRGGIASTILILCSVTLGGSIHSIPAAFATSGIAMALIYLTLLTAITAYTMHLYAHAIEFTGYRSFPQMGQHLLGPGWGYFVGILLSGLCLGAAIGYVGSVEGLMSHMLRSFPQTSPYLQSNSGAKLVTSMVWLLVMLPLSLLKSLNTIRYTSAIACLMVVYFVGSIVTHSVANGMKLGMRGDMQYFTSGNTTIYAVPIFVFSYLCQILTYPLYFEMRPEPSARKLVISCGVAMPLCMILYILVGFFGYMDFSSDTKASVLMNFNPYTQRYMLPSYVGVIFKLCVSFSLVMCPTRSVVLYCVSWDAETVPRWRHVLVTVCTGVFVLLLGIFLPSANIAFGLAGSLCGGFVGYVFPAVFRMYCGNWSLRTVGPFHYIATYGILFLGVVAIVFGTITSLYGTFLDEVLFG